MLAQLVPMVATADTSFSSSSTVHAPVAVAAAFLDLFRHLLLHCPGTFAALVAQLVVPKVSTAETSLFSSTVQAPLAVAEAFLDMFHHFCRHCFSFRPGTFAAVVAQLVVPKVATT
jgi:hypothetical protein